MRQRSPRRRGFTLVELLVAVALAVLLAALAVAVTSGGAANSQTVIRSADKVSSWLAQAKMRAIRDAKPRGVQFLTPSGGGNFIREAQYVEVPERFVPRPADDPYIVLAYGLTPTTPATGQSGGTVTGWRVYYVAAGDTTGIDTLKATDKLILPDFGLTKEFELTAPPDASASAPTGGVFPTTIVRELKLKDYPDLQAGLTPATSNVGVYLTRNFGFTVSAGPVIGEPLLLLGSGAAIDVSDAAIGGPGSLLTSDFNAATGFTVLFNSYGQVINTDNSHVAIWVRDPNRTAAGWSDFANAGEQSLVVVTPRTGTIATRPVFQLNTDPFRYMRDATNTGF